MPPSVMEVEAASVVAVGSDSIKTETTVAAATIADSSTQSSLSTTVEKNNEEHVRDETLQTTQRGAPSDDSDETEDEEDNTSGSDNSRKSPVTITFTKGSVSFEATAPASRNLKVGFKRKRTFDVDTLSNEAFTRNTHRVVSFQF